MADLGFKNYSLGPKTAIFGSKKPCNTFKTAKRRETVGTRHVRLDFPVSTSSLRPSNSMICPGNGPKRPPEAPNADSHKPRIGHIFGYMAQNAIARAPTPPAIPHFLWFPTPGIAQTDAYVPAAHWWLSGNVKLGLLSCALRCFVLVWCAFCMLGNVHLMLLLTWSRFKVGGTFFGDGSVD